MIKKIAYILGILYCCTMAVKANALEFKEISKADAANFIKNFNEWFRKTESYSVTIQHITYAGHNSAQVYEQSKGYYKKYADGFHSYMMNVHCIQNNRCMLTVDSVKKTILVHDPVRNFVNPTVKIDDYLKILEKCQSVKLGEDGKSKTLRVELDKKFPIEAYEFGLNKEGLLSTVKVFYRNEVKLKTGQKVKPELCILFNGYKKGISALKNELDETHYVRIGQDGSCQINEMYKGYTLLDQRANHIKP